MQALGLLLGALYFSQTGIAHNVPQYQPLPELDEKAAARYVHPEYMATFDGRMACKLPEKGPLFSGKVCDKTADIFEELNRDTTGFSRQYMETREDPIHGLTARVSKKFGKGLADWLLGARPSERDQYEKGLAFLEMHFLKDPHFFERSEEEILDILIGAHDLINGEKEPLRDFNTLIFDIAKDVHTQEGRLEILKKAKGVTPQDIRDFKSYYLKRDKYGSVEKAWNKMTWGERNSHQKIAISNPHYLEVKPRMLAICQILKEIGPRIARRELDPVLAAAWTQQHLSITHPWKDANGRFARAVMLQLLHLGGIEKSVPFRSDKLYSKALKKDLSLRYQEYPDVYRRLVKAGGTGINHPGYKALLEYAKNTGTKVPQDFYQEAIEAYPDLETYEALSTHGAATGVFPDDDDFYKQIIIDYARDRKIYADFNTVYQEDFAAYEQNPKSFAKFLKKVVKEDAH